MTRRPAQRVQPRDRGAVTPLAAATLTVLIGIGGLVTDVGVWYAQRRNLQGATDAAAMAAVNHTDSPTPAAAAMLAANGFSGTDLVSAQAGYYCPDAGLAPSARFQLVPCPTGDATPAAPNAVKVAAVTAGPRLLSAVLQSGPGRSIGATAIAARVDEVGVAVRSGAADVSLPLANGVLQSLLGGSGLSLSAVQYDGLLSTDVDALGFFDALAAKLDVTAGTYGGLLATDAHLTDVLEAQIDALDAQDEYGDTSAAVAGLQAIRAKVTGNPSVNLGQLFDLGTWKNQAIGGSGAPSALRAGLNAYQLAVFSLQVADGEHAAAIPVAGLGVPGLASATVEASAIEPPQSSYFAFGPEGVSVHTAQVRLRLTLTAAGGLAALPVYLEVGQGTATVSDMDCGLDPATEAVVTVRANSALATLYLGEPPAGAMSDPTDPVDYADVEPTPLVNVSVFGLGLVQVRGKARSVAAASAPTDLTFVQPPPSGVIPAGLPLTTEGIMARSAASGWPASEGWPAQVVSSTAPASLTSGLWSNLALSACILNCAIQVSVPGSATATLNSALKPLLQGLDPLINGILEPLGVSIGKAQVLVTGVRCGVPALVS